MAVPLPFVMASPGGGLRKSYTKSWSLGMSAIRSTAVAASSRLLMRSWLLAVELLSLGALLLALGYAEPVALAYPLPVVLHAVAEPLWLCLGESLPWGVGLELWERPTGFATAPAARAAARMKVEGRIMF
jgi:hypothetical protein